MYKIKNLFSISDVNKRYEKKTVTNFCTYDFDEKSILIHNIYAFEKLKDSKKKILKRLRIRP